MAVTTYTIILKQSGIKAFTMPQGYWPDVEIHCWGAGGGNGRGGARGGGGGYAKTTVNIYEGDEVSLQIGQPGTNGGYDVGGAGGFDPTYKLFRGGNSSRAYDEDADTGAGGGGGGASWVAVNGTFVCVGAGGGGAGGYGDDSSGGYPGLPGGVTTNGLNSDTRGGDAPTGWATGGGGGAGFPKGGAAGTSYGDDSGNPPAGSGGQNYGNVTVAGSGINPGGTNVSYYPGNHRGEQGYAGYIILILRRKLNINIKNADGSGNWTEMAAAYYKLPTLTTTVGKVDPPETKSFTSIGTSKFTVPQNVSSITVRASGGGGGGGGADSGDTNHAIYGLGGSASDLQSVTLAVSPGDEISFNIGGGGAGATTRENSYPSGGTGGTTTVTYKGSTVLTVPGGAGGASRASYTGPNAGAVSTNGGANGGAGSAASYNSAGSAGQTGKVLISYTPAAYTVTTVTGGWKQIQQAYVKVSGNWKPILTNKGIVLYDYPVKRIKSNIIVSSNTTNYNLYDNVPVTYFEGLMDIDVWVLPGVEVTSTNTGAPAFAITGFSAGDRVVLHNYGTIEGRGGDGGAGYYTYSSSSAGSVKGGGYGGKGSGFIRTVTNTVNGTAGGAGGIGLELTYPTIILNDGVIAGGGGGGGGGGQSAGGQGGGGAGYGSGYNNGTLTAGGAGQNNGGAGGGRGQDGTNGSGSAAGVGGSAGYAIQGATNIYTGSSLGTYYGPLAG